MPLSQQGYNAHCDREEDLLGKIVDGINDLKDALVDKKTGKACCDSFANRTASSYLATKLAMGSGFNIQAKEKSSFVPVSLKFPTFNKQQSTDLSFNPKFASPSFEERTKNRFAPTYAVGNDMEEKIKSRFAPTFAVNKPADPLDKIFGDVVKEREKRISKWANQFKRNLKDTPFESSKTLINRPDVPQQKDWGEWELFKKKTEPIKPSKRGGKRSGELDLSWLFGKKKGGGSVAESLGSVDDSAKFNSLQAFNNFVGKEEAVEKSGDGFLKRNLGGSALKKQFGSAAGWKGLGGAALGTLGVAAAVIQMGLRGGTGNYGNLRGYMVEQQQARESYGDVGSVASGTLLWAINNPSQVASRVWEGWSAIGSAIGGIFKGVS